MIEITVKTLDSQNHSFSVPDDTTVRQFKEKIVEKLPFPVESQRLIYCGRVLQDDKNLSEYDVNGKVIHLVQRPPPQPSQPTPPSNRAPGSGPRFNSGGQQRERRFLGAQAFRSRLDGANTMYLGAMAIPADIMDANGISTGPPLPCLSQSRLTVARRMLTLASSILTSMESTGAELVGEAFVPPDPSLIIPAPDPPSEPPTQEAPAGSPEEASAPSSGGPYDSAFVGSTSFYASAFSAARSSGVPSTMTIHRRSRNSEPLTLSLDMDAQGNIINVSSENGSPPTSSTGSETPPSTEAAVPPPPPTQRPPATPPALASVMDDVNKVNQRLQQFYARYHELLRDDPTLTTEGSRSANALSTRVSEVLHCLSHAYHAMSDITCNFSSPPPRQLRCRPVLIQHSAVVQAGIPINMGQQQYSFTSRAPAPTTTAASTEATPPAAPTEEPAAADSAPAAADSAPAAADSTPAAEGPPPAAPRIRILRGQQGARGPPTFAHMSPGNLELIMEVGPGSITIDSVEATLLSGNTAVPLGTLDGAADGGAFPWGAPAPPELLQNLMQAVAGHVISRSMATPAPAGPASTSASGEGAGSNSQARGNTATHPTTSTQTRSTSRPHVHLAQSLPAFDPFLPCNSHHCRPNRQRAAAPPPAERDSEVGQTTSPSDEAGSEQLINLLEGFIEGYTAEARPPAAPSAPAAAGPAPGASESADGEAVFPVALVEQIMQSVRQGMVGNSTGTTLVDVLNMLPYHFYSEGEYLFTDLIMVFARNLSFQDIFALQLGQGESLDHLQTPLHSFISQRVLQNEAASEATVARGASMLANEIRPFLNSLTETRMRPEVHVVDSVNNFIEERLREMINSIAMGGVEGSFGRWLTSTLSLSARELYTILRHCCADDAAGVENIVRCYVRRLTNGVPQALRLWTVTSSLSHLRTFTAGASVPVEQVQRFIALNEAPAQPEPAQAPPEVILEGVIQVDEEPMETDAGLVEAEAAEQLASPPDLTPLGPLPEWRNALPSDWVPIIAHDSQRQRRQNPQAPFSDAYLSGLPSKRRKVVSSAKPQGSLNQVIAEGVRHAAEVTGLSPHNASVDLVAEATGADANIQAAYRDQVRAVVRDSLASNPDYVPERFPNTAKYFAKK